MNLKQNAGPSSNCLNKSSGNAIVKAVPGFFPSVQSVSQLWSVTDLEEKGEQSAPAKKQSCFQQPAHNIVDHNIESLQGSVVVTKGENIKTDANPIPGDTSAIQDWRPYAAPASQPAIHSNERHVERKRIHAEKGQGVYTECARNLSAASNHVQPERTHARDKLLACGVCGKHFNNQHFMLRHQKTHTEVRPHTCSVCGNSFRLKAFLTQHLNIHTGEKPFHCSICGKSFSRKGTLVRHQVIHMK